MEKEPNSSPVNKSNKTLWIVLGILGLFAVLASCLLISLAGFFTLRPLGSSRQAATEAYVETLPTLDEEAEPLLGQTDLQRGYSPDPYVVAVEAGGPVDTSSLDLDCGYVSASPTFAFRLSGGASETFLRIFFAASDGIDTTLVVRTPHEEWLCADHAPDGSGMDPVIDLEFAPSGRYTIWVGTRQNDTYGKGSLYITQSEEIAP